MNTSKNTGIGLRRILYLYRRHGYESRYNRLRRLARYLWGHIRGETYSYQKSICELRRFHESESSLDDVLDTAFSFKGYGKYWTMRPRQTRAEISELVRIIEEIKPDVILEIGTGRGGTLYIWSRYFQSASLVISIDLEEPKEWDYSREDFFKHFDSDRLRFVRGDAHNESTLENVCSLLEGRGVDFLFLDTRFDYEYAQREFELYAPLLQGDGIIAFHDIAHPCGTIDEYWNELKDDPNYEAKEIIFDSDYRPYNLGIGVLHV